MQAGDHIQPNEQMDELLKQAFLDLDPELPADSRLMDEVAANVLSKEWPLAASQSTAASTTVATATKGIKAWIWILSSVAALGLLSYLGWEWHEARQAANLATARHTSATASQHHEAAQAAPVQTVAYTTPSAGNIETRTGEGALHPVSATDEQSANTTQTSIQTNTYAVYQSHITSSKTEHSLSPHHTHPVNGSTSTVVNLPVASSDTKSDHGVKAPGTASLQDASSLAHPHASVNTASVITSEMLIQVPQLSEGEKLIHTADMEQMLGDMAGLRFNDYHQVEVKAGAVGIKGGYYIKRTEVSIKEYTLFLNDLLVKGRNTDYETARPKPELVWNDPKDRNNKTFLLQYFKKRNYENYPIICITPQGMELYCAWLQTEIEGYYKRNQRTLSMTVRLPLEREWQYAATEGRKGRRYGTQNGRLKIWKKGYIVNFAEKQQKFIASDDTIMPAGARDGKTTHRVNRSMFIERPFTNVAYHGWELSDMSGNVSEVVALPAGKDSTMVQYRSIGGNWNSPKPFLRVDAPDEFPNRLSPSPYIGFRPVIIINP